MIPIIGLMIGLYILARYSEMAKGGSITKQITLAIFALITIFCIFGLMATGAS